MRFKLSFGQILAIVGCLCLAVNVDAAKKPKKEPKPVVASDVVCDACIGPGEISPGTVGIPEVDQGLLDLVDAGINANAVDISENDAAIQANTLAIAGVAAITVPRMTSNGQDIGALLNGTMVSDFVSVLSNTGYTFSITPGEKRAGNTTLPNLPPGTIKREKLTYATSDCTGQAYVDGGDLNRIAYWGNGVVIASENWNDPIGIYYSPKGSTFVPGVTLRSKTEDQGLQAVCVAEPDDLVRDVFEVFPNDPQITGVTSQRNFDPPITLDVQTFLVPVPSLP